MPVDKPGGNDSDATRELTVNAPRSCRRDSCRTIPKVSPTSESRIGRNFVAEVTWLAMAARIGKSQQ